LDTTTGITRLRGRWFDYALSSSSGTGAGTIPATIPALATYHPAYLLRQPAQKRDAWRDLVAFRKRLDELEAAGHTA
ncbi:MAG TPA: hypothetical protein VK943_07640, partial [Arenibaculum sp.]|nr:hypothetical protein [Arenibaculum sp.]